MENIVIICRKESTSTFLLTLMQGHSAVAVLYKSESYQFSKLDRRVLDSARIIFACLESSKLSDLACLQELKETYIKIPVLAMFDIEIDLTSATYALKAILRGLNNDPDDNSKQPNDDSKKSNLPGTHHDLESVKLTPRQIDVLERVYQGKSNKVIARELDLCEGTVKIHCMAIFRELGVINRTQAAIVGGDYLNHYRQKPSDSSPLPIREMIANG